MNAASGLGDLTMDEGAREHQVTRMDWSSSRDMQRLELDLELGWSLGQDKPRTWRRGNRADAIRSCGCASWRP